MPRKARLINTRIGGDKLPIVSVAAGKWVRPAVATGAATAEVVLAVDVTGETKFEIGQQLVIKSDDDIEFQAGSSAPNWSTDPLEFAAAGATVIELQSAGTGLYVRPVGGGNWNSAHILVGEPA